MWILNRVSNDDKVYLLRDKPKYTVGRNKNCDIVSEGSQSSVGRFHATLQLYEDHVDLVDAESKYGTYVNDQIKTNVKITPNSTHALNDGDTVRFGFIDFTWTLEKVNIVALTSTLNDKEKDNLRKDISILGGQVIDQWSDTCTHLVVKNLTFTVKVLQSLCHAIPIVTPEYFSSILSSIRNKSAHPKLESFEPPIVERILGSNVSLQVNIDRKRLFAGKTFIFMNSRHMEKFQGIIECGMGQCSSLDKKKWQRKSLVKPGFIVINNTSSSTQSQVATQALFDLNEFLRSNGNRMIPETEITLAILHCSLDKFCNPKHTLKDNFESNLRVVSSKLLADNTPVNQNEIAMTKPSNSINVPETIEQSHSLASTIGNSSNIIDLMDDDDDIMLVQGLDDTMKSRETNEGKRKISMDLSEEQVIKKPHLEKNAETTIKPIEDDLMFRVPTSNARSVSKVSSVSIAKPATETTSAREQDKEKIGKQDSKSVKTNPSVLHSNQCEPTTSSSVKNSFIEQPEVRNRDLSINNTQPEFTTSTQLQSSHRKRIAHRPFSSTFTGNNSDSDDELFKFTNEPIAKKSKPSKGSDSDSDDNMNYPTSSRPNAPIIMTVIPSQTVIQSTQLPDSWLSRPTPSQNITDGTVRPKPPKQRANPVRKSNTANVSAGWQIGQHCISTQPIGIPTQGWCSKDMIKSKSSVDEIKQEYVNEKSLEESKWIRSGIQVITRSMNLISTSGKVFKKQRFIAPSEVIKTTKIYQF